MLLPRPPDGAGAHAGHPSRPYRVDLLLCGHHYRLSQWTLAAAEAMVQVLPGRRTTDVFEMALL